MLVWVRAGEPCRRRVGQDRRTVRAEHVLPPAVLTDLRASQDYFQVDGQADEAQAWAEALRTLDQHVLGCILVRPLWSPDPLRYLPVAQRTLVDYWGMQFQGAPLLFVEVLERAVLDEPCKAELSAPAQVRRCVFQHLSVTSANRCSEARAGERPVSAAIAEWRAKHNGGRSFANESAAMPCRLDASMPAAHGLLVLRGTWREWAFPLVGGRQGTAVGMSLPELKCFRGGRRLDPAPAAAPTTSTGPDSYHPSMFQGIADELRLLLAQVPEPTPQARARVEHFTTWAQGMRDHMVASSQRTGGFVHCMQELVSAVLMSGLLRAAPDLRQAMLHSVRVLVPEGAVREYYIEQLLSGNRLPSTSSLYRHRLTICMGYAALMQKRMASLLEGGTAWSGGPWWTHRRREAATG